MSRLPRTRALYAELATSLGMAALIPDLNGGISLEVGEGNTVVLFGQDDVELLIVSPVAPLPPEPSYGQVVWLLRQNLYDAPLHPFRVASDANGTVLLWGRVPLESLNGAALAGLLDALAAEVERVRAELGGA